MDINRVIKVLKDYENATGCPVNLINLDGELVFGERKTCLFCKNFNPDQKDCKAFMYGCYEAQRFGGKYIFFCPMGFTYWTAPVIQDSRLIYGAVGGPVIMVDLEDFVEFKVNSRITVNKKNMEAIGSFLENVMNIEPSRVTSLSEQLSVTCRYLSRGNNPDFLEGDESQKNQSRVSEYIHYIKSMSPDYWESSYPLEKEKELIVVLSRAAIKGGGDAERIFGWNYQYIKEIQHKNRIDHLVNWLNLVLKRFSEEVFDSTDIKHINAIYKAKKYLKLNYMKKITQEEVAQSVGFSPAYFSKIFKQETGESFSSYLNYMRIENSKKFLQYSEISLIDAANMVGFEDQSYYSKVFKKLIGVTPGRWELT